MDSVGLHFLTDCPLPVSFDPAQTPRSAAAVTKLADFGADCRPTIEEKIYDFYCQEIEDGSANFATAQDQIDWENKRGGEFAGATAATQLAEVWPLVRFRRIEVRGKPDGRVIVRVEGNAAWDGEHGIVLHFDEGANLLHVSEYGVFL